MFNANLGTNKTNFKGRKTKKCDKKNYICTLKMNLRTVHINILFLIVAVCCLQSVTLNSISSSQLFFETEIEESILDSNEIDFEKELSLSDSDNNGSAIISSSYLGLKLPFDGDRVLLSPVSKGYSKKLHLFILFCCLKLDC